MGGSHSRCRTIGVLMGRGVVAQKGRCGNLQGRKRGLQRFAVRMRWPVLQHFDRRLRCIKGFCVRLKLRPRHTGRELLAQTQSSCAKRHKHVLPQSKAARFRQLFFKFGEVMYRQNRFPIGLSIAIFRFLLGWHDRVLQRRTSTLLAPWAATNNARSGLMSINFQPW